MSLSVDDSSENVVQEAVTLKSCPTCERTFNPKSLERHKKICEKTKKCIQRTPFNSFLQRAKEIGVVQPVKAESKEKDCPKSRKKWREEHESLIRVVRLGKNVPGNLLNNGLSPQNNVPPGYHQCPSCERHFSEKAADRHIAWCQEQRSRLPKTPNNLEAMERLRARVKYQAPLPRRRSMSNLNERLVKSAESVRNPSSLRLTSRHRLPSASNLRPVLEKSSLCSISNLNTPPSGSSKANNEVTKPRKAVKFKEMFPLHDPERNRNLDMLAALRIRLSELSVSEELVGDLNLNKEPSPPPQNPLLCSWSGEQPRFCYNCGTRYPIESAKFCCECGAQRFIFNLSDTRLSMP